jgi:Kef-type K+ transport system membrane component KefB
MTSNDFALLALQIAVMLACAVFFGQLARRLGQPAVLGEMIGGILLGPTIFGAIAPSVHRGLFLSSPTVSVVRDSSIKMGMLFFLFIAGLEVNLADLRRLGRRVALIGVIGTLLPIAVGVGLVYLLPVTFWGEQASAHSFAFALFIGMNLANSANPVIARILMDLGLLKDEIGVLIMTATIVDDLINWTLFAIVLSNISPTTQSATSLPLNIVIVFAFFALVLGVGRWIRARALQWLQRTVAFPTGFIAVITLVVLLAASVAEGLGIHAFLGAFLVGAALGSDDNKTREARNVVAQFVLSFFAPIYFVSMGLSANFITNFDFTMIALITVVACVSKIGSVMIGALLGGMPLDRKTLAVGFGLNARGATGIILASVGRDNGVIDDRIFVAIVVMALVTSLMSGPAIKQLLRVPVLPKFQTSELSPVGKE